MFGFCVGSQTINIIKHANDVEQVQHLVRYKHICFTFHRHKNPISTNDWISFLLICEEKFHFKCPLKETFFDLSLEKLQLIKITIEFH